MIHESTLRSLKALIAIAFALTMSPLAARELRVNGTACGNSIHVVARDVPLSDVLKALSRRLEFEISFEAESDPQINVDTTSSAADILTQLAGSLNFSMSIARDPTCGARLRVTKMSVLPSQSAAPSQIATTPSRHVDVMDKQNEGAAAFLAAHGYAPSQQHPQLNSN